MTTPTKRIGDLAAVTPGFSPRPEERKKSAKYLLLGGRNIKDGRLVRTDADSYVGEIDRESFRRAVAKPGDAIVSTLFDRRKLYLFDKDDPPAVVNNSCAIIEGLDAKTNFVRLQLKGEIFSVDIPFCRSEGCRSESYLIGPHGLDVINDELRQGRHRQGMRAQNFGEEECPLPRPMFRRHNIPRSATRWRAPGPS